MSKIRQAQSDEIVNRNLRKYVTVDIFNNSIKFQLDSGSDISINHQLAYLAKIKQANLNKDI